MARFERVKQILDDSVQGANIGAHGAFWRGATRDEFVPKSIFGFQLLTVGDGSNSNLVKALQGEPPFGADLATHMAGKEAIRQLVSTMPESQIQAELSRRFIESEIG